MDEYLVEIRGDFYIWSVRGHFEIYYKENTFYCSCDNWREVEEELSCCGSCADGKVVFS